MNQQAMSSVADDPDFAGRRIVNVEAFDFNDKGRRKPKF